MTQTSPIISIIAIVAHGGAIGRGGDQPFHISEDFKRFKALTMDKPIIMGRKTFEALPGGALPRRRNIVVTRNAGYSAPGIETAPSLHEAIALAADAPEIMIIGGGEIYRQAMDIAHRLYITSVDADVADADTFFPEISPCRWTPAHTSETFTDPRSGATYRFINYKRQLPVL